MVEKPSRKGCYSDVSAFGILSFEKAGVIHCGVRNTFVWIRITKPFPW
jgi:hypothetical protein